METEEPRIQPATNADSFERQMLTKWAANQPPSGIEISWTSEVDVHGGHWVGVRHPDYPTYSFGFYVEADAVVSRFIIEPVRLVADGVQIVGNSVLTTGVTGVGVQLTRRLLREVPFGELERAAREIARSQASMQTEEAGHMVTFFDESGRVMGQQPLEEGGGPGGPLETQWRHRLDELNRAPAARSGHGGRPPMYSDAAYALMAYRYATAAARGQNPIDVVAKEFYVSRSQARNLISTARKKGLLTQTQPGRVGGMLTPHAAELLEEGI